MPFAIPLIAVLGLAADAAPRVDVTITQRALVAVCLNGRKIDTTERKWRMEARPHAVTFTMGDDAQRAGYATIRFTPEAGHKYEIEVRAPATSFSTRVWERGTWTPAVRDRTGDRIVSGEPEWSDDACPPQPAATPSPSPSPSPAK